MQRRSIFKVTLILVLITCIISGCSKHQKKSTNLGTTPTPQVQETAVSTATPDESPEETPSPVPTDSPSSIVIDTHNQEIKEDSYGYYYDQLTREQKIIYFSIFSYKEEIQKEYIEFTGVRLEDFVRSIDAINCDQPFLRVESYIHKEDDNSVSIMIKSFEKDLSTEQKEKVEEKAKKILDKITGTDEKVIRKIYNWCTKHIKYDETLAKKHTRDLYGALIEKECVCEGYAEAFKYLCDEAGLYCINVQREGEHMWNYVQLDGQWYSVDTTGGQVNTKIFLLEGKESLEIEDHIPENSSNFSVPTLAEKSVYPTDDEVQETKSNLEDNIAIVTKRLEGLEKKDEYDKGEYQLLCSINEKAKDILEKINRSVFYYYMNTSEFSEDYNEWGALIEVLNKI